jgi:hypothetical protein
MEVKIEGKGDQYMITVDAGDGSGPATLTVDAGDGSGPATLTADSEIDAISDAWQYLIDRGIDDETAEQACRQALGLG